MSDNSNSRHESINRRSVLAAGGISLAGLGTLSSLQGVSAQEDGGDEEESPIPEDPIDEGQQTVSDDTGTIQLTVPATWNDINGSPAPIGPTIMVSPDLEGYWDTWAVPGIEIHVTTESNPETALDNFIDAFLLEEQCTAGSANAFQASGFDFLIQTWTECGGNQTMFVSMAGVPVDESANGIPTEEEGEEGMPTEDGEPDIATDASYVLIVGAQILTEEDLEAVNTAIKTLVISEYEGQNA